MTRRVKDLDDDDWIHVRDALNDGHTWGKIADDLRVKWRTLQTAALRKGFRAGQKRTSDKIIKKPVIPARILQKSPDIRHSLIDLCESQDSRDDPELLLLAGRDRLAALLEIVTRSITDKDEKYKGMDETLGMGSSAYTDGTIKQFRNQAAQEDYSLRDLQSGLRELIEIEKERMPYKQPKLSAIAVQPIKANPFADLSAEEKRRRAIEIGKKAGIIE